VSDRQTPMTSPWNFLMDRSIRLAEAKMQRASTLSHTEWHPCALPSRPSIPLGLSWLMIRTVRKERTNQSIARSSPVTPGGDEVEYHEKYSNYRKSNQ
jgi:hypothetical protein